MSELSGLAPGLRNPQIFLIAEELLVRARNIGAQLAVIKINERLTLFYERAFGGMNLSDVAWNKRAHFVRRHRLNFSVGGNKGTQIGAPVRDRK